MGAGSYLKPQIPEPYAGHLWPHPWHPTLLTVEGAGPNRTPTSEFPTGRHRVKNPTPGKRTPCGEHRFWLSCSLSSVACANTQTSSRKGTVLAFFQKVSGIGSEELQ